MAENMRQRLKIAPDRLEAINAVLLDPNMRDHRPDPETPLEETMQALDYIVRSVDLKRLIADRPCPVIITCRREQDGGKWVQGP